MSSSDRAPGTDTAALFLPEGDRLVPTTYAVGPWRPDAVHGAAVAALFAAALDRNEGTVARVTLDMLASVPLRPLRLEMHDEVGGRTVQRRTAVLRDDERTVAQAHALYVTGPPVAVPAVPSEVTAPPEELSLLPESRVGWPGFESQAMALHMRPAGDPAIRGWFRLLVPAIGGVALSGLQMALAAADYTASGTAMVLSLKRFTFMSVDLTVNLVRPPVGDWVGLEAGRAVLGDSGVAVAASALHDAHGVFGRCTETQVVRSLQPKG